MQCDDAEVTTMAESQRKGNDNEAQPTQPLPAGQGESAQRRIQLEKHGGQPLTEPLEDGQLRGADEEGRHTTGTHGGPKKDGSSNPKEGNSPELKQAKR
jgi:hypothetical protein